MTATMRSLACHLGPAQPRHRRHLHLAVDELPAPPARSRRLLIRQVKQRDIDYEDLTRVDHLVRDILERRVDLTDARATARPDRLLGPQHRRAGW